MKNDLWGLYAFVTALVIFSLGIALGGYSAIKDEERKSWEIEKKCIYENRVEFSGQLFSCQWLPGVTTIDKPYERKPHPNKEVLK